MKKKNLQCLFQVAEIARNVWQIEECGAYCYLIAGEDRALLIDTANGFGDLAELVKTLTPLPVTVTATHAHPDHIGGRGSFPAIYLHKKERRFARFYGSLSVRRHTVDQKMQEKYGVTPRDMHKGQYRTKYVWFDDGFTFDLGGRTVRAFHTAGHTKGHCSYLLEEEKMLFAGDNVCRGIWLFLPWSTTVATWIGGAEQILALSETYTLYTAHETEPMPPELLARLIATAKELVQTHKNTFFPRVRIYPKNYTDHAVVYRTTRIK